MVNVPFASFQDVMKGKKNPGIFVNVILYINLPFVRNISLETYKSSKQTRACALISLPYGKYFLYFNQRWTNLFIMQSCNIKARSTERIKRPTDHHGNISVHK